MAMAKCRECGTEVSDQAKTCPKCGVSKPVKKTSLVFKLLLGFFGVAIVGQMMTAGNSGSSSVGATSTPTASPAKPATAASPPQAAAPAPVDPVAERAKNKTEMEQVRKRLAENREHLKKYYGTKEHMQRLSADHLKVIAIAASRGMSKHEEDQKQATEAKNLAAQVAEQMRDMYASTVEQIFVKSGMDAQVRAGGKGKERLTITYALMSQPLVYKFQNDMDVPTQAKRMGFAKVVYTNGFESSLGKTWTIDL